MLASNTRDLVVKKMVYLFLCAQAQANAELSLLCINTLQKDCRDEDPMVRARARRWSLLPAAACLTARASLRASPLSPARAALARRRPCRSAAWRCAR